MKTTSITLLTLVLAFVLAATASPTSVTGILTDDMCTKKHMMPGKPDADCVRACIKHGAKFVVVSQGKVYTLQGKQDQLNELAGKKVVIVGELKGKTLTVNSITPAQ